MNYKGFLAIFSAKSCRFSSASRRKLSFPEFAEKISTYETYITITYIKMFSIPGLVVKQNFQ